jgi:3-hydroxybutyryl-CoA dehydrogenase
MSEANLINPVSVGVVGAGVMGKGVAYRFAKFGYRVVLIDSDDEVLRLAPSEVRNMMRHERLVLGGAAASEDALDRITYSRNLGDLHRCGFVVENITEDRNLKLQLYQQFRQILAPQTVVAVNTSTIAIGPLAELLSDPSRILGVHFMNPVYLKSTVELIVGDRTSDQTVDFVKQQLAACGMRSISVRDRPGFVINRVFMVTVNEAINCLGEGIADARAIDQLFQECLGQKMGPLATADLIGLDTVKLSLDRLKEVYGDEKYNPAPLLVELVSKGRYGCKTGIGVFSYEGQ